MRKVDDDLYDVYIDALIATQQADKLLPIAYENGALESCTDAELAAFQARRAASAALETLVRTSQVLRNERTATDVRAAQEQDATGGRR